jgi:hypothetical protein
MASLKLAARLALLAAFPFPLLLGGLLAAAAGAFVRLDFEEKVGI